MAKSKAKATGGHRMRQLGYLPVMVWFERKHLEQIAQCANVSSTKLATWIREAALKQVTEQRRQHFYG